MADMTGSQTVGPFFHLGLIRDGQNVLASVSAPGRIRIEGRVTDGEAAPVTDAMIEIWQADGDGRFPEGADDGFTGFGRAATDDAGEYRFETIKPGAVPGPGGRPQAPHVSVSVFARGLLKRLCTRIYFDGEDANAADPVLAGLADRAARDSLIAHRRDGGDVPVYRFDIVLQGERETVFFDV